MNFGFSLVSWRSRLWSSVYFIAPLSMCSAMHDCEQLAPLRLLPGHLRTRSYMLSFGAAIATHESGWMEAGAEPER
ncbi:unnamed protein product [Cuscuta epithymum]|uniref:Secreted protein n=1 Tax=Cuscuta epithymum TaxID=186058 RepID=A0AAV0DDD4_9ASTE|nr:unnamed protein product [Cuscuta epithymum]